MKKLHNKFNIVSGKSQEVRDLSGVKSYLSSVKNFLDFKLSRVRVIGVKNLKGDVKFFKLPVRGTKLYYQFHTKRRFKDLKRVLSRVVRVEGNKTNAVFLTLTFDFGVDFNSLGYLWSVANREASYFINRLRKKFKRLGLGFEYIRVVEAQRLVDYDFKLNAKPHFHFVLVFDKFFTFHRRRGKFWFSNKTQYEKLLSLVRETWGYGFVSLVPVCSVGGAVGYLAKYVSKSGYIDNFLNFSGFEDLTFLGEREGEIKKSVLFYYLLRFRLRFFSVSRGLKLDKKYINNSDTLSGDRWVLYRGEVPIWVVKLFRMGAISIVLRGFLNSS